MTQHHESVTLQQMSMVETVCKATDNHNPTAPSSYIMQRTASHTASNAEHNSSYQANPAQTQSRVDSYSKSHRIYSPTSLPFNTTQNPPQKHLRCCIIIKLTAARLEFKSSMTAAQRTHLRNLFSLLPLAAAALGIFPAVLSSMVCGYVPRGKRRNESCSDVDGVGLVEMMWAGGVVEDGGLRFRMEKSWKNRRAGSMLFHISGKCVEKI